MRRRVAIKVIYLEMMKMDQSILNLIFRAMDERALTEEFKSLGFYISNHPLKNTVKFLSN